MSPFKVVVSALIVIITVCSMYEIKLNDKKFEIRMLVERHNEKVVLLEHRLEIANTEIAALHKQLGAFSKVKAMLTWYCPDSGGINTDGDPEHTATMTKPRAGRTVAISTELVKLGWLGKCIYIEGHGVYVAEDRMNVDLPGYRIDICAPSEDYAINKGRKYNIPCYTLIN